MNEVTLKFDGRVAVVTCAAGNIGLATCCMFCESGVRVAATDLSAEALASGLRRSRPQDMTSAHTHKT